MVFIITNSQSTLIGMFDVPDSKSNANYYMILQSSLYFDTCSFPDGHLVLAMYLPLLSSLLQGAHGARLACFQSVAHIIDNNGRCEMVAWDVHEMSFTCYLPMSAQASG